MFKKHIPICIKKETEFQKLQLGVDYTICGVCNMKLIEINNAHLAVHNITPKEYNSLYHASNPRLPESVLKSKNHFKNGVTKELSNKLKFGHTLEGYIEKHGYEDGIKRYNEKCNSIGQGGTLGGYIKKYGELKGIAEYNKK